MCVSNQNTSNVVIGSTAALTVTLSTTLLIVVINRKRLLLYKFLDFCQTTGLLLYINTIFPYSISKILETLNLANFSPLVYLLKGNSGLSIPSSRLMIPAKF